MKELIRIIIEHYNLYKSDFDLLLEEVENQESKNMSNRLFNQSYRKPI